MSHLLPFLALAFIAWQWSRRLRPGKEVRPAAARPVARESVRDDVDDDEADSDDNDEKTEAIAEVAGLVSSLLGERGREVLGEAVSRAMKDAGVRAEINRRMPEAIAPIVQAVSAKRTGQQAPARQRAKYLLDGDNGFRQRSDRTARLQQSFRGKGLCSPR